MKNAVFTYKLVKKHVECCCTGPILCEQSEFIILLKCEKEEKNIRHLFVILLPLNDNADTEIPLRI